MRGPEIGGGHFFVPGLASSLVQRGHRVHLVGEGPPHPRLFGPIAESGAVLHTDLWPRPAFVENSARAFAEWANHIAPDAYFISTSADVGWVALPFLDPGIPTVAVVHLDSSTYYIPLTHYRTFLSQAVAVSRAISAHLIGGCGFAPDRVAYIPYGVQPGPEPGPTSDRGDQPLRLVYVSRLAETQKRSSDVIRIVESLRGRSVNYSLTVIGDGQLLQTFCDRLAPEIAEGRVAMRGWLQPARVRDELRRADVFLLTSDAEGFSIALLEAMANGVVPVITDIPSGNRQVVKHLANGVLVPVGDIPGFVTHITHLSGDRRLLGVLRKSAWETGQAFTATRMVNSYMGCFETAARVAGSPPGTRPGIPADVDMPIPIPSLAASPQAGLQGNLRAA